MSFKRILASSLLSVAVLCFLTVSSASAATLNVVGGQLFGASGVIVDGSSYNVEFLDGTCIALFDGCDDVSDFTFTTPGLARAASEAILDQVFIDDVSGMFDSDPVLTFGCELVSPGSPNFCSAYTPYESEFPFNDGVFASFARNFQEPPLGPEDAHGDGDIVRGLDTTGLPGFVFAVWSPVPEPGTALFLGLGLAGLALRQV
jgi:hypothetical protein